MKGTICRDNKILYTDRDIHFSMDGITVHALNLVFSCIPQTIPSHSHGNGCYEIHYTPYGYGRIKADGQYYDIGPNTLYVTGPHVEHEQIPAVEDPMWEYCVYLKIHSNLRQKKASPLMEAFLSMNFWIGEDTQGIHLLMKQMFEELEYCYIGYQNQTVLLLSQLLVYMVRNYVQNHLSQASFDQNNLTDSKSIIIEESFLYEYQHLTLSALADRLKLCPRQTQRLLMEYYGKTFQEKKTEAKMSAAVIMLADKGKSITSIAEELGYSSAEHFSSAFRKYYAVSPREYRKHL